MDLTETGRMLNRLPVDPRIGRMIVAANDEHCLSDILIIASAAWKSAIRATGPSRSSRRPTKRTSSSSSKAPILCPY